MGQRPQVRLRAASTATRPRLWLLLQRCLRELAKVTGVPAQLDAGGEVRYPYYDAYWHDADRHPFGVWFGSSLAGLCLLRDLGGGRWQVAEFYVDPAFRRQGIGLGAVEAAAAWCAAAGASVLEARVHTHNGVATAFWARAGFHVATSEAETSLLERSVAASGR